jgi:hypothetical protein
MLVQVRSAGQAIIARAILRRRGEAGIEVGP